MGLILCVILNNAGNLHKADWEKASYSKPLGSWKLQFQNSSDRKDEDHDVGYCVNECTGESAIGVYRFSVRELVDLNVDQDTQSRNRPTGQDHEEIEPPETREPASVNIKYSTKQEENWKFSTCYCDDIQECTSEIVLDDNIR